MRIEEERLVTSVMQDHELECPFCHKEVHIEVVAQVKTEGVRRGSSSTFRTEAIVDLTTTPKSVRITHECSLEKKV